MTSVDWSAIIAAIGFLFSLLGSAFIAGLRWGTVKTRLDLMETRMTETATKEQLSGVKEDVAEIKGMFHMTLKNP